MGEVHERKLFVFRNLSYVFSALCFNEAVNCIIGIVFIRSNNIVAEVDRLCRFIFNCGYISLRIIKILIVLDDVRVPYCFLLCQTESLRIISVFRYIVVGIFNFTTLSTAVVINICYKRGGRRTAPEIYIDRFKVSALIEGGNIFGIIMGYGFNGSV